MSVAADPERCDACGKELKDGQEVVTAYTEVVRDPNGNLQFDTQRIETRRHNNCP